MTAILLAERAPADAQVLGAGGGLELQALAKAQPGWRFTGVDPAGPMLDLARETLGEDAERVELVEGYIDAAPAGPFDAATCLLTIHFLDREERVRTLREMHRRMTLGAPLVVVHSSFPQSEPAHTRWLSRYVANAVTSGVDPAQAEQARSADGASLALLTLDEDEACLRDAGFGAVNCSMPLSSGGAGSRAPDRVCTNLSKSGPKQSGSAPHRHSRVVRRARFPAQISGEGCDKGTFAGCYRVESDISAYGEMRDARRYADSSINRFFSFRRPAGMTTRFTRRQAWQLGAVVLGGLAIGRGMRWVTPVGRDVGRSEAVSAILGGTGSPRFGQTDATLRLAVFSDYRCPACRSAFPELESAIRTDGAIQVISKDWPIFGDASERAARVALASAAQGIYSRVHHALMTDDRGVDDGMLEDVVTAAGGDWARVTADLRLHGDAIDERLRSNGREALSIGLTGTPGYLAGRILQLGALDAGGFARLFARARAES